MSDGGQVGSADDEVGIRWLSKRDLRRLAGLIDASNPYIAVEPKTPFEKMNDPAPFIQFEVIDGVYVEKDHKCPGTNPTYKILFDRGSELQDTGTEWKFKGAPHYVKRVLRIPYMYYQVTNKQPGNKGTATLVMDYWLIGFEGSGGY